MKTTIDGYPMKPGVWFVGEQDGQEQWTWGYVPASGSRYQAISKGIWPTQKAAEEAMLAWAAERWHAAKGTV